MSEAEKEAGEGFLSRWSRRKREVVEAPEPPGTENPLADVATPGSPAVETGPDAPGTPPAERAACPIPEIPAVDPASLPPLESLTVDSDFSAFLKPGVPTLLRNAALRRMWSLDPAIRDYIGPVDYQWDFNIPGGLPFGFANELTGDVSKLLAQAIGKIEELAEATPGEATPGMAEAGVPNSPLGGPAAEDPEEEAPPAMLAEANPAIEPPPLAPEPALAPRRRHGGALPG
jgi:hypothetical protein